MTFFTIFFTFFQVKMVFPDGSQETRYSNGRVRLKNKDGKLIMDSETISI